MGSKMLKLGEFAARSGISDRHARRLFSRTESDLVGHFEKRGASGTWIDEHAAEILRGMLTNPVEILPVETFESVDDLKAEIADLQKQLYDKDRQLSAKNEQLAHLGVKLSEVASAPALLEAANSEKERLQIRTEIMSEEIGTLKAQNASLSIENEAEKANTLKAEKNAQKASEELSAARAEIDKMKNASLWQRIRGWKD